MDFVSVFDEASRDHEAEQHTAALTLALGEAEAVWPFLALAQSRSEFGHRLALQAERLTTIAQRHGLTYEAVAGPLERGFEVLAGGKDHAVKCDGCGDVKSYPDSDEDSRWKHDCGGEYQPISKSSTVHTATEPGSKGGPLGEKDNESKGFMNHESGDADGSPEQPTYPTKGSTLKHGETEQPYAKTAADYGTQAYDDEMKKWYQHRSNVTYTDGSPVQHGDKIRYHQAPGGLMAHGDWSYGEAVTKPHDRYPGVTETTMRGQDGRHYNLFGHVIERAPEGKTSGLDPAYASLHQALMDGQDPLEWIVAQNPPGGPQHAQVPSFHADTQQFGGTLPTAGPVAYTQAMDNAGTPGQRPPTAKEQPSGHSDIQNVAGRQEPPPFR